MKLTERSLRELITKLIKESDHKWSNATSTLLMLDKEGMEKSDRENVKKYLAAMRMID